MNGTGLSEVDRERLAAFKAAMTRCRWLLLTTILVACFMLLHLFTGEFGFQTEQVKQTLLQRLRNSPGEFLATDSLAAVRNGAASVVLLGPGPKARSDLAHYVADTRASKAERDRAARDLVEVVYGRLLMNHELNELKVPEGTVPLLGVAIPGNDYIAIMTWMLVIFSTALWLSIRSLEALLCGIDRGSPLRDLVRLHVTFTGLWDTTPGARVARALQYAAVWLPTGVFFLVCGLDIVPALRQSLADPDFIVMGEPLYVALRIGLFVVGGLWLVGVAVSNSGRVARVDAWLYSEDRRAAQGASSDAGSPADGR